jgi:dihydrofolate reductase
MKVLFYPAVTLDGFIADSDGGSAWVTEEDEQLFIDEIHKAGCVIVGRTTFEQYQGTLYPVNEAVNFLCTSKTERHDRDSTIRYVSGSVDEILTQVADAGFKSAVLSGGADTNGRFAEARAIDEVLVSTYPIILGTGLAIFGSHKVNMALALIESGQLSGGVIRNRYKVVK